jgi:hypothetical protein
MACAELAAAEEAALAGEGEGGSSTVDGAAAAEEEELKGVEAQPECEGAADEVDAGGAMAERGADDVGAGKPPAAGTGVEESEQVAAGSGDFDSDALLAAASSVAFEGAVSGSGEVVGREEDKEDAGGKSTGASGRGGKKNRKRGGKGSQ